MGKELVLEFDCSAQMLDALQAAAYRLIGVASCQIEKSNTHWVCRLSPRDDKGSATSVHLRKHFLDLVTDENLREKVSAKTESTRNLILSLAFGSLANADKS